MNEGSKNTWRVFSAIDLPEPVRALVGQHISALRRAVPEGRASWSRPEGIHLTLKFLGHIPIADVGKFSSAVGRAVESMPPFRLGIGGTGTFPPHGSTRVLWIGVHDSSGRLAELHERLEAESAAAGFERETRSFHPHLTLARLRQHDRRMERGDNTQQARFLTAAHKEALFPTVEITVSELFVIRSELGSAGSKYTVISRHRLDGPDNL
ncbi:MAG: RNA 2',3'-cyclic phosphodiesterase [Pyrinomonadaceae bacterium]|nr:RNA 2',3'-cyclic phosphodiesterase [Pyrinomonadaceae bacterium]